MKATMVKQIVMGPGMIAESKPPNIVKAIGTLARSALFF
jgi:hypothetical protein